MGNKLERLAIILTLLGMLGSVIGFFLAQRESQKTEMIRFVRELNNEFNNTNDVFRNIRMAIERCERLYGKSGKFDNDQINRYLNFFDTLGFYESKGYLALDLIDQMFGAYIIEAYEYDELRDYIQGVQTNAKQQEGGADFVRLAKKLEAVPGREDEIKLARSGCDKIRKS